MKEGLSPEHLRVALEATERIRRGIVEAAERSLNYVDEAMDVVFYGDPLEGGEVSDDGTTR